MDDQIASAEAVISKNNLAVDQCSSVDFQLSAVDLRAWSKYQRTHNADGSPKVPATRGLRALLLLVAALVGFMLYSRPVQIEQPKQVAAPVHFELSKWLPITIVVIVVFVSVFLMALRNRRLQFKNAARDLFLNSGRLMLLQSSIHVQSDLVKVELLWEAIRRIVVTNAHFFFIVAPSAAYIVPRRSFRDETHVTEFLTTVQQYYSGPVIKQ